MNVFVHLARGLLEPMVWQVMQWIWSLEGSSVDEQVASSRLQLYSYSSTSTLLWIFERMPHTIILMLLATGVIAVVTVFLITLLCTCRLAYRALIRFIVPYVVWNILKMGFISFSYIIMKLFHLGIFIANQCRMRYLSFITTDEITIADATDIPIEDVSNFIPDVEEESGVVLFPINATSIAPIEATAFRPRRRRNRAYQTLPQPTHLHDSDGQA